jgi:predicted permease
MASLIARLKSGWGWLVGLVSARARRRRLDEEIRFHLDMETAHNLDAGQSATAARRSARLAFGGEARFRAQAIDQVRSRSIDELGQDLRYGIRGLLRTPTFTIVSILILALGIGSTTVFFSIADHVVLRPLPYPEAHRLVLAREQIKEFAGQIPMLAANAGHFLEWQRRCAACEQLAAIRAGTMTLSGHGDPEQLGVARVSANLFPMLGARVALGRLFSEEDDRSGGPRVAVLSDGLWRRLGADPTVVGRILLLDETPWTVVGVVNRGFRFPRRRELEIPATREVELFTPLALSPAEAASPGDFSYGVIGRVAEAATTERMRAELEVIQRELSQRSSDRLTFGVTVKPLQEQIVGSSGKALVLLLGAVAAVLLVVSVNLAHLLLARNLGRAREWAVRLAIGARGGRLVRQTLTESLLLASAGGALGILLATWGLSAMLRLAPADLPRLSEIHLDGRVLAVALLVTVAVGLGFGALPAHRSSSSDPADALRGARATGGGPGGRRRNSLLIGTEVALCSLLLFGAGLFLNSFLRVTGVDRGFAVGPVVAVDLSLPIAKYRAREQRTGFYDELLSRLGAAPGVASAALATAVPLEGETQVDALSLENDTRSYGARPLANIRYVSPDYFATIETPLVRGRLFSDADRGRPVVVLSERAATALWPNETPLGRRTTPGSNDSLSTVIGVVADIRTSTLENDGSAVAYLPYWSNPPFTATVLVRGRDRPEQLTSAIRAELRALAPTVPIGRIRTMPDVWSAATAHRRFQVLVLMVFAITAIVTAAVGIFGIVAHSLGTRTAEIGLRLALGAEPARVHRQVLREGLVPVVGGLAVGLALAVTLGNVAESLLFEVRPSDPITLAAVTAIILAVAGLACWLPARRATAAGVVRGWRIE